MFNENIPQMMLQMRQKIEQLKENLKGKIVEGTAAGGMIRVKMNGLQEVIKVEIEKDVLEENEKSFLEDLLLSALNDAIVKSHRLMMEGVREEFGVMIPPNITDIVG